MGELPWTPKASEPAARGQAGPPRRIGVFPGALGADERLTSLAALFPHAQFELVENANVPAMQGQFDVLIVAMAAEKVTAALQWLRTLPSTTKVIIVLHDADVATLRLLLKDGAADVIPAPASEASIAVSLERLFATPSVVIPEAAPSRKASEVVSLLKAGGGAGATFLGVQAAAILARRNAGAVCFADLDLQNGVAAAYFDLHDAFSIVDGLVAGAALAETPFASALPGHKSGVRLMGAPSEVHNLDSLSPSQAEALLRGLRRDFALTFVDLPQAWTAWTTEVLRNSDRIVLVTRLTVPHVQMVKRQLRMLATQQLDSTPLTLVCNAVTRDQQSSLSIKAAERALGRDFDVVVPSDERTVCAAVNQGLSLVDVRKATPVEKGVTALADKISAQAPAPATASRFGRR